MPRRIASVLAAALLCPVIAAGQVPIGPEFRVNSYTTGLQDQPRVAGDTAGNFVVVWRGYGPDASGAAILAQRYDSSGVTVGSEFRINTYTTGGQYDPFVASDPAGNFVVAWTTIGEDS